MGKCLLEKSGSLTEIFWWGKLCIIKKEEGMDVKSHPTRDYMYPICKPSTRSATSKADAQKFPLSQRKSLYEIIF